MTILKIWSPNQANNLYYCLSFYWFVSLEWWNLRFDKKDLVWYWAAVSRTASSAPNSLRTSASRYFRANSLGIDWAAAPSNYYCLAVASFRILVLAGCLGCVFVWRIRRWRLVHKVQNQILCFQVLLFSRNLDSVNEWKSLRWSCCWGFRVA